MDLSGGAELHRRAPILVGKESFRGEGAQFGEVEFSIRGGNWP